MFYLYHTLSSRNQNAELENLTILHNHTFKTFLGTKYNRCHYPTRFYRKKFRVQARVDVINQDSCLCS